MPTVAEQPRNSEQTPGRREERSGLRAAIVAPRHRDDPEWPWVTELDPMRDLAFRRIFIDNVFEPLPKLTGVYRRWQFLRAARAIAGLDLAFSFSTDVGVGLTTGLASLVPRPRRVYVGFTQDGPWPASRISRVGRALRRFEAVCVFTESERRLYIDRYALEPDRVHVIPIHTDETSGYEHYSDTAPRPEPYVLSLGSPNRRFVPVAAACRRLGVPLIVMTRPHHRNDALDELDAMGAEVVTDADRVRALTHLKHARLAVMVFQDPSLPGGYTTLVHAMFLRTPFVVTECLGMREHVVEGETGFVAPHGDDEALEHAIGRLWNEPGLSAAFGDAAHERAQRRHSLEAAARSYRELARKLMAER